jgi:long-chain acyl-CoA synthetase
LILGLVRVHPDSISLLHENCKQIYIGGASFDRELEKKLLAANVPISIGYGMTETGPMISYSTCDTYKYGTCGKIVDGMMARIAPNGEILVKGENVMLGYYKNPEATAQKIDADGWLHTGDRGHLDEDGYLYVEGRLEQDMIVLPNGENIHPDNIESKINALPEVAESIVIAREGKLVAIVVVSGELSADSRKALRLSILRSVNAQLPMYAQIYDIEWSEEPLARTAKQTIKRYLYK